MPMYTREDSINLNRSAPKAVIDCALDRDALFTPQVAPLTLPDGTVPSTKKVMRYFALFTVRKVMVRKYC